MMNDNTEEIFDFETEFTLPNTLSAMAKKFYVKTNISLRQDEWYIKQGSTVTGVKVIAQGKNIRDIERLIESNLLPNGERTKAEEWYKCRGTAIVTNGTNDRIKEIHWYQCKNIGKIEFKVKNWGDDDEIAVHR